MYLHVSTYPYVWAHAGRIKWLTTWALFQGTLSPMTQDVSLHNTSQTRHVSKSSYILWAACIKIQQILKEVFWGFLQPLLTSFFPLLLSVKPLSSLPGHQLLLGQGQHNQTRFGVKHWLLTLLPLIWHNPEDLKYFRIISKMASYVSFHSRHIVNSMQVPQQLTMMP